MIFGMIAILRASVSRTMRRCAFNIAALVAMILCGVVGIGFATFAAYVSMEAVEGPIVAALSISACYGLFSILIWISRRFYSVGTRQPLKPIITETPIGKGFDHVAPVSGVPDARRDQDALIAAFQLARGLSPLEGMALALAGGLLFGRRFGK